LDPQPCIEDVVTQRELASVLCGALLAASVLGAQSSVADTARIPFIYDDARIFVPIGINRDPPRWLILDTGAPDVMLDADLARGLGIAGVDAGRTGGAGQGSMAIAHASGATLRVGTVSLGVVDVNVAPLDSVLAAFGGRAALGVVGAPLFSRYVVELDFSSSTMTVRDPDTFRYRGHGIVLPMQFVGGLPMVEARLAPSSTAPAIPMKVLVDIGAKATLLVTEPFIAAHDLMHQFAHRVESPLGAGVGGETRYAFARAASLTLVDSAGGVSAALSDPVVGLSVRGTLKSDWCDGLLGAEFLHAYRVIFDYAHRSLILEPRDTEPKAAEYDMSGMFIMSDRVDHHRFTIHEVLSDGPAAHGGLRVGDRVVSVDGRPATSLTLGELRNVLRSAPGRDVALTVERDGATLRRTVRLVRLV
jgi:hypothetical protein